MVPARNKVLIKHSGKEIHHRYDSSDAGVQKIALTVRSFEGTCYTAEFFSDQL